jgi:hypothetical protein
MGVIFIHRREAKIVWSLLDVSRQKSSSIHI